MRSLVWMLITVCCAAGVGSAQSNITKIKAAEKELKRALINHTPNVYAVNYSDCKASVKIVTGFSTTFENMRSMPPQGSAGFPADTFWTHDFGPAPRGVGKSTRYLLDLAKLDASKVTIRPGLRKNTSVITLSTADHADAIRIKKDDEFELASFFFVTTDSKHASKLVSAMKAVIERCSEAN